MKGETGVRLPLLSSAILRSHQAKRENERSTGGNLGMEAEDLGSSPSSAHN